MVNIVKNNKFIAILVLVIVVCNLNMCFAGELFGNKITHKFIIGDWYDKNGNLVLSIYDNKINGIGVVNVEYVNGSLHNDTTWKIKLLANKRYFDIILRTLSIGGRNVIVINNKTVLHRSEYIKYFESIGGVYIGMSEKDLLKLYGEPTRKEYVNDFLKDYWYDDDKWKIRLFGEFVGSITIFKDGTRKFDRTGFDCNTSIENYLNAYQYSVGGELYAEWDSHYCVYVPEGADIFIVKNLWPNEVSLIASFDQ